MTTTQIVDTILPLTKQDYKCGFQKKQKLQARAELFVMIDDYKNGYKVNLPDNVKQLLCQ